MDMEAEEYVGSMADLLQQLGDVPLHRIRVRPAPGTATEQDVLDALEGPQKRICELVDGVLIEKPMVLTRQCWRACWVISFGSTSKEMTSGS